VVRRLAGERDGRPVFTDVLGTLLGYDGAEAIVAADRGEVRIPVTQIIAAKRIPPRATPRRAGGTGSAGAEIAALEWTATAAWPAPHTARLGDWLLRAAGGWTGRANSVLPLGDPGRPLDEALALIAEWYAGFGLPARLNVPLPLRIDLDRALDERGWGKSPRTLVQVAPLAALTGDTDPGVRLAGAPDNNWLAMMAGVKGALPTVAAGILTGPEQVRFASISSTTDTGTAGSGTSTGLLAIARGVVGDGWLHLALIQVARDARRQGLARRIIAGLAGWAAELGAQRAYLQVEEVNTAATTLYGRLGFTTHHSYFTRTAPTSPGTPRPSGDS